MKQWTCGVCGSKHEGFPDSYGYDAPWYWDDGNESSKSASNFLNEDYCVIDNEYFFVRGCIEIPIIGMDNPLLWGVWSSLSRKNFDRDVSLADDPNRIDEPPYFSWLSTRIEIYPDTLSLKCKVHSRPPGQRPYIELESTNHPLAIEQSQGITVDRLIEIAEKIEHEWRHPLWKAEDS